MNIDSQSSLIEQAQAACYLGQWSLLIECLQQLLGEKQQENELEQLLDLAIDALVAVDFAQRWDMAKVFPKLGERAIAPLIGILEDEDSEEELRWFAGRILGEFNHPQAIAALIELLKTSHSEELTIMAAAALGQIGSSAVAPLTELLAQENTRLLAVRSLSYIRSSETIAPLLNVVQDGQVAVRSAAIEALSSFHDSRIPPILLNALDDMAAAVRREAVTGLSFRSDLREQLDLVNHLIPKLHDFNILVCTSAAIALGRLGTDAAATGLFKVLHSPNTPVILQIEIVRALGRIETATSLEYLHQALKNQQLSVTVWQEIVMALGRVEQPQVKTQAAAILIELLQSGHSPTKHESIKQALALSLGQLGALQALDSLIELLAEPNATLRLHVIAALKHLPSPETHQKLQQIAANEAIAPLLKQGVAIALTEW